MKLSKRIKKLRLKLMLTQIEFSKLLGVAQVSVNRYENDKSKPTLKIQRKIDFLLKENGMEGIYE